MSGNKSHSEVSGHGRSGLRDRTDYQYNLEAKIIRDLIICTFAVIIFSCAAYLLNLVEMLAEWLRKPELKELDTLIIVVIYTIWISGIFVLRRLYELRHVASERRRLVEQLHSVQKMETVEKMAAGLAHDFNNVLYLITGLTELSMSRNESKGPISDDLNGIKMAVHKAGKLVDQLLAISSGKHKDTKDLNLNKIITTIEPLLHGLLGAKIELVTNLEPQLATILADEGQIDQVVINIVKNGIEAISQKENQNGTITVTTANISISDPVVCSKLDMKSGDYVMLSIADNGYGIDPAVLPHIFEPYFTTKTEGTGLGLAMVMSIVNQNMGRIDVESETWKGTKFNLYFPAKKRIIRAGVIAEKETAAEPLLPLHHPKSIH